MSKYSDLLKSPLWQKKRLEIMSRDNFRCIRCGDDEEMLAVHHKYYDKTIMPWEYPDKAYQTLCNTCHNKYHKYEKHLTDSIVMGLKMSPIDFDEYYSLSEAFKTLEKDDAYLIKTLVHIITNEDARKNAIYEFKRLSIKERLKYCLVSQQ